MSGARLVAIHQPNFLPWLGYFDKLVRADVFVVLDNVQMPKKGGSWANRVRVLVGGEPAWLTVPIVRAYHGVQRIAEVQINESTPWREKALRTVRTNYSQAPHAREVLEVVERVVREPTDNLSRFNMSGIAHLAKSLGIDLSKLVLASSVEAVGSATDLLVSLVKAVGGTAYLCGGGAAGYQEDEKFAEAGIELVYQNFKHPTYPQANTQQFVPGLSIVDALMNCGFDRTRALLAQECGPKTSS